MNMNACVKIDEDTRFFSVFSSNVAKLITKESKPKD